jgi:hypothetical protein
MVGNSQPRSKLLIEVQARVETAGVEQNVVAGWMFTVRGTSGSPMYQPQRTAFLAALAQRVGTLVARYLPLKGDLV